VQRLQDRVAVITGASGGIGAASARRMAAEGARLVLADTDADAGRALADELDGLFVQVDVTSPEDNERMYALAVERFGGVDVAFHNAGISPPDDDSITTTGLDAWRRVQEVNLTSVYLGCKAVLPHMLARGRGAIINTASFVASLGAATSQISYTASKGGVLAMTRELGVQFARQGVRVNALAPGLVRTPMAARAAGDPATVAYARQRQALRGDLLEPDEVTDAALFLVARDSRAITGQMIAVDGGWQVLDGAEPISARPHLPEDP